MNEHIARFIEWLNQHFAEQGASVRFLCEGARIVAHGFGSALNSTFQPVVSAATGRTLGWEAAVWPYGLEASLPTTEFLRRFARNEDMARADRACRSLHLANFIHAMPDDGHLFLHLHPRHLLRAGCYGEVFAQIVDAAGVPPERIVLEILEHEAPDEAQLADVVKQLKAHGFLIALDDFGHADQAFHYDRLTALKPNIVKFHPSLMAGVCASHHHMLRRLVSAVHALGATVVATGISHAAEAHTAREVGVDMLQGHDVVDAHAAPWPASDAWLNMQPA